MGFSLTTFVFEIVNFGLLIWLLNRLVYRPLAAGIEARRLEAAQQELDAELATKAAEEAKRHYEEQLLELDQLRARALSEVREQAGLERARLLEQARDDAQAERSRVDQLLETEREAAMAWVGEAAIGDAVSLTGRLLMDLVPQEAHTVLLERLLDEIRDQAKELAVEHQAAEGAEVELEAGQSIPDEFVSRFRTALDDILGARVRLAIRDDPELLAGAVLRIGNRVLDASVGGGLELLEARARSMLRQEPTP